MDDYYPPRKTWKNLDLCYNTREKLRTYRDEHRFKSYSEAIVHLMDTIGIPNKKVRGNPFINSKNYYIAVWSDVHHKLIYMTEKGEYGCINNVIETLLRNSKD